MNTVTFTLDCNDPKNAAKYKQIGGILFDEGSEAAPTKTEETPKLKVVEETPPKEEKPKVKDKPKAPKKITQDQLRDAVKAAKKEHGEDFCMLVFSAALEEKPTKLGKAVKDLDEDLYGEVIAALEEGPDDGLGHEDVSDDEGDGLGDDDDLDGGTDDTPPAPDAVKEALLAYKKTHGRDKTKELMTKHKLDALANIGKLAEKNLVALFKAATE